MKVKGKSFESNYFLKVQEVADLLRTSKKAIYSMYEKGLLPGGKKIGRRLLFYRDILIEWLEEPELSPKGDR